jgi:hypothetical protein
VLPYAVRVVSASLNNLRSDMEEAAVLLGSSRLGAFFRVVMPNIRGGILAGLHSRLRHQLQSGSRFALPVRPRRVRTLPIDMLGYMETTYDPSIAALSALLAFLSIGIVFRRTLPGVLSLCLTHPISQLDKLTLAYGDTVAVKDLDLRSKRANSSPCSALPAAARPRRCARSPAC